MHTRNTKVEMKQLATGAKWNAEEAASQTALKGIEGLNTCNMPASVIPAKPTFISHFW